jgi:hypothetical protein
VRLLRAVALSFLFRFACYALMLWLALWSEARPAPSLPDAVLSVVPYVGWVDRNNYLLWIVAYVPVGLLLLKVNPERFIRYMISSGVLALLRGLCIAATGLGPVHGADLNAGLTAQTRAAVFWKILNPFAFFAPGGGAQIYLTKDLFFSGHTATTFLLLLYVWRYPRLRVAMVIGHGLVVVSLFLAHLHYTIDVIGAYAITFALFALREGSVRKLLAG